MISTVVPRPLFGSGGRGGGTAREVKRGRDSTRKTDKRGECLEVAVRVCRELARDVRVCCASGKTDTVQE